MLPIFEAKKANPIAKIPKSMASILESRELSATLPPELLLFGSCCCCRGFKNGLSMSSRKIAAKELTPDETVLKTAETSKYIVET